MLRFPNLHHLASLLWLSLAVAGCAAPVNAGGPGRSGSGAATPNAGSAAQSRRRPPVEDVWSIRCVTLNGPQRFKLADGYADALRNVRGLKSKLVQVFHEGEETNVYYGQYRRTYDERAQQERFKPDPLKDMDLIRVLSMEITDAAGLRRAVWPFRLATMTTLPTGAGLNPQWELSNAPGHYSLQVGVFYNSGQMRHRKYAAEEYCRVLREQGEEAYYHHGEVNSSVCIGAFPETAIQTFQRQDPYTGIIQVTSKITNEHMLALQRRHSHNLHNGVIFYEVRRDPATGRKIRDPHTSFAVEIPRKTTGFESLGG